MKILPLLFSVSLLATTQPWSEHEARLATTGCEVLSAGEADQIIRDVRDQYAPDSAFRATHGVPAFPPASAQFYNVAAACDSAEVTYRTWRVTQQGDSNVVIPVTLVRLGATQMFLGTALIGRYGYGREYVVYDSVFTVKHVFTYQ